MKKLLGLLLLFSTQIYADEPKDDYTLWLTSGMESHHNDRAHHYRENNTGIGLEMKIDSVYSVYIGEYANSLNKEAHYIGYAWQPLQSGHFSAGFLGVVTTGYTKNGSLIVAPIPVVSYEYKYIGVNFMVIPTVVTAFQLKVRFK